MASNPVAVILTSDVALFLSKNFLNIQATIECSFILKRLRDMIRTYRQFIIVAEKKDFFFQPYLIMDRIRNIEICKFKSTISVILNETAEKKWSLY